MITKMKCIKSAMILLLLMSCMIIGAQNVPERMYFKFDAAGAQPNLASAPVGLNPAPLLGMSIQTPGQFGAALVGTGASSFTNYLNTGWATSLQNTGWTISMWLNNLPVNTSLYYLWGDPTASSFRCFLGGAAGAGNLLLRGGGFSDVNVPGVGPGPTVVHFVYTGSAIRCFKNGVFSNQVNQPSVNTNGSGPFKIGGYSSSAGLNGRMDEFRMYNRALSDAEVALTWNQTLPMYGIMTGTVTNNYNGTPIVGATVTIVTPTGNYVATTGAGGVYTMNPAPAGTWNATASADTFLPQTKQAVIVANQTTTLNFQLDPMPGVLAGIVTNAATGNPVIGARITISSTPAKYTYSVAGGAYSINIFPLGTWPATCSKAGYENLSAGPFTFQQGVTITQNFPLLEALNAPVGVVAVLNALQTQVDIAWGVPVGQYELLYEDGIQDNFAIWAQGGNLNAVKFTPVAYPATLIGGSINVGTSANYPTGNPFVPFKIIIYDATGPGGTPGTAIDTFDVVPTAGVYGWIPLPAMNIAISSGNFYIAMLQGGNPPNALGLAVDETNPQLRSYERFVLGGGPWVPANGNFMIRAIMLGAGGPTLLDNNGNIAQVPPDNTDVLTGYQVWRLKQGEEGNQAVWTSIGTPTTTSQVDPSWPSLPNGPYRWAVKAGYTNNRWSGPTFSNVIGKGWTATVTVNEIGRAHV